MKVATLEKFHLRGGGYQDPGDPGVGKVKGGGGFFFVRAGGGGTAPGWHYVYRILKILNFCSQIHVFYVSFWAKLNLLPLQVILFQHISSFYVRNKMESNGKLYKLKGVFKVYLKKAFWKVMLK